MNPPDRIRTVIADDEQPARELIATLLRGAPDIEVVAECADGAHAIAAIEEYNPDLVFLDVQMPDIDGFAVLAEAKPAVPPFVVFVTAYDQHAIRAFGIHAIDYVLKPFEYDRLRQSVELARARLAERRQPEYRALLRRLVEGVRSETDAWDRIAVRDRGRVIFVRIGEIGWIEAEGNYARLHVGRATHLHRETMAELETRLAAWRFVRVSRSALVNLDQVREWQPLFHGDSVVILNSGEQVQVSRKFRDRIERWIVR